jgi:hypothetical protein
MRLAKMVPAWNPASITSGITFMIVPAHEVHQ